MQYEKSRDYRVLAIAWELLSFSLRYPMEELVQAIFSGEWLESAVETAYNMGLELSVGFSDDDPSIRMNGRSAQDSDELLKDLRTEATRLFVGAPTPIVNPYESAWRAKDDGMQAILFASPYAMAVQRFCTACNLGRPEGTNEPLDHIATELELLAHLALLSTEEDGCAGSSSFDCFPGGSPMAAHDEFFEQHLVLWAPRFFDCIKQESRLPFYRSVGTLGVAFMSAASCWVNDEARTL